MIKCALIGSYTTRSFSKYIHESISDVEYELVNIPSFDAAKEFIANYDGHLNITIPYKKLVNSMSDVLSKEAKATGVVNTLIKRNNRLYGYNTDVDGFKYLLETNGIDVKNKACVIFGSGATSSTVSYVLKELKAKSITVLSRAPNYKTTFSYDDENIMSTAEIIINTTPNKDEILFKPKLLKSIQYFIDVNYLPYRTAMMVECLKNNIRVFGGLDMLLFQAFKSNELFTGKTPDYTKINLLKNKITKGLRKVFLAGHSFSGKTSIAEEIRLLTGVLTIDLDRYIESKENMRISEIFTAKGQDYFRKIESKYLLDLCASNYKVISLGGGTLLKDENLKITLMTGLVVDIDRDLELVTVTGFENRPLIKSKVDLVNLINRRESLNQQYRDYTIENNASIVDAANQVKELL